ncbi:putative ribonuclease H-like domain-containing protein [Tanacetum coccineum]|uniref:Ribonuclease H-like domain-containing protein n=1 Tax=Tanacetum coccineum TaxID=301880 RepID=A0ABQ4ZY96_9ASTR
MKSGIKTLNTAGQNFLKAAVSVNTARPVNTAYPRPLVNSARTSSNVFNRAHSHVRRPFNNSTTNKNINLKEKVNTVKGNVTTDGPKAVVSDNKGNEANVVKASACWVWRPKQKILDHVSRHNGASMNFKRFDYGNPQLELYEKGVIDSGCSRHMTGNKSYLSDYEEINGGFVAFGGDPKGGKITSKGKISTGKLDFKDVYFVKELKFNLFSVSQMCDKKNSVLFIDIECVVLSPDFKLLDENHVLLRVPRKDNMYSVDLMNIVPSGGIENLVDLKVKVIICDNGTEFKNKFMNQFCEMKGRKPALSFMRPFGCPVTILNTLDHLGKFDGKADEGFFIGYSTNSKAYRVFNSRTRIVEENLHVKFSEETPNIAGNGPNWLFDIDALTISMNYKPVVAGNQTNGNAGTKENIDAGQDRKKLVPDQNTNNINTVSPTVNAADIENNDVDENTVYGCIDDPNMPNLEEIVHSDDDEVVGAEADIKNLATTVPVSPIPTTRVHKDHSLEQIIRDIQSAPQTRRMTKNVTEYEEPKKKVWTLVELPYGKRAIGTKWVYRNKKDNRGIVIRNKARLVAQGYTQEEGIDYDEVFDPVARIEAIMLFLAYASFMNFIVYQMDRKSAFLYGIIEEEVYVCQPPGFEDPKFPNKVYKVEKALYGLHQAFRAWYETLSTYLCTEFEQMMHKQFQMSYMGELTFFFGLQVKQKDDGMFISQDKYVANILKKFDFATIRTSSTPIETNKALLKDEEAADVDVHLYRSMIGSLMYLTASRPDIIFAICACARFQVTLKVSHLHVMKRIFRYLKGQPKLGLWYPRDSPYNLEAFSNSNYASASLDMKSTIGGYQFLGRRLISWQCKKQTIVANFTTDAEYVVAANCCGQTQKPKKAKRATEISQSSGPIPFVSDATVIKEWEDKMERAATTDSSLEAGNLNRTNPLKTINLMLLSLNLLLPILANAARHKLTTVGLVNTVRLNLMLSVQVNVVEGDFINTSIKDKPEESERFEQIIGFLNASSIRYALTIQALVDKKRVIITETSIRSDLKLEDAEGIDCLPTTTIFAELERMSAKTIAWNEFSSTMASAVICLAKNQKFNFSKYIFDNMVKNLEGGVKFLMYPRRKQRKDNGPIKPIPDEATNEEHVSTPSYDPSQSGEDRLQLTELMSLCTSLQEKVLDLEKAKTAQAKEIASLKKRVKQLEKRKKSRTSGLKRLRKDASKQGRKIADLDADEEVTLIDETQEINDEEMLFDVQNDLQGEEVVAEKEFTTVGEVVTTANVEVTTASATTTTVDELKSGSD